MSAFLKRVLSDDELLLTEKEAAEMLRLTNHRTLANWRSKGWHRDLKFIRIGRSIRYLCGQYARLCQHTL
jgi:Helix-turn-helix domain